MQRAARNLPISSVISQWQFPSGSLADNGAAAAAWRRGRTPSGQSIASSVGETRVPSRPSRWALALCRSSRVLDVRVAGTEEERDLSSWFLDVFSVWGSWWGMSEGGVGWPRGDLVLSDVKKGKKKVRLDVVWDSCVCVFFCDKVIWEFSVCVYVILVLFL